LSEIRANTVSDAAGTGPVTLTGQNAAKSWINHNAGTTIGDSFNCTSVVDYGTGYHQHSFISAHANIFYAASGSVVGDGSTQISGNTYSFIGGAVNAGASVHTASALRYSTVHWSGGLNDQQMVQLITHGDLA